MDGIKSNSVNGTVGKSNKMLNSAVKYRQNLPAFMTLCEQNYFRIMRLMPKDESVGKTVDILVANFCYQLEITASAKFTTEVSFRQTQGDIMGFVSPKLMVRVYHDARVAEVFCLNYPNRVKPSYHYPNPQMRHKDEKYQINAFLFDWLDFCISHGRSRLHWDVNNGLV